MLQLFKKYNVPDELIGKIYSYISFKTEFDHVIYDIDVGIHNKILYLESVETGHTNIYGFPQRVRRIVAARDAYKLQYWAFSPDPEKRKIGNVHLSEKYSYNPNGWPDYKSNSAPQIICNNCNLRMKYKDKNRNKIFPICRCGHFDGRGNEYGGEQDELWTI